MALQNRNVDAVMGLHTILRNGAIEWSSDVMDFAGRHFQGSFNGGGWPVSANPFATLASHLRYCQAFGEDCLSQAAKALQLAAKVSRDSREHLDDHALTVFGHLEQQGSVLDREKTSHPS